TVVIKNLRGNVRQGDRVTAVFTVDNRCNDLEISLASYTAPSAEPGTEHSQQLFDSATGFFNAGEQRLTVQVPDCFFQIDFAFGPVIQDVAYGSYNERNIDADVGGTHTCENASSSAASSTSSSSSSITTSTAS